MSACLIADSTDIQHVVKHLKVHKEAIIFYGEGGLLFVEGAKFFGYSKRASGQMYDFYGLRFEIIDFRI